MYVIFIHFSSAFFDISLSLFCFLCIFTREVAIQIKYIFWYFFLWVDAKFGFEWCVKQHSEKKHRHSDLVIFTARVVEGRAGRCCCCWCFNYSHTLFFSSTWGSFFSCYFLLKLGSFTFKVYYFLVCVSDTNEERGDWEIGGRRIVTQSLHQICWFFFF